MPCMMLFTHVWGLSLYCFNILIVGRAAVAPRSRQRRRPSGDWFKVAGKYCAVERTVKLILLVYDETGEVLDWSMSAVMKLVKEYEKRRQLWDKSDDHYHSHESKNSTWAAIANVFSCSSHDVRKKFRSVLASYRRERAKVRDGHRSTWFLYPHLRFLPQYVHSPGDSEETVPEQYQETEALSNHSDDTHVSDEEQEIAVTIKEEPAIQVISPELYESSSNSKKKLTRTMKKRPQRKRNQYLVRTKIPVRMNQCRTNQTQSAPYQTEAEITYSKAYVDSKILELQKTLKTESLPRKDDCDTYGEYIASTLRKHDNKTQCRIKQAINNILFEEEMCKYDDPLKTGLQ